MPPTRHRLRLLYDSAVDIQRSAPIEAPASLGWLMPRVYTQGAALHSLLNRASSEMMHIKSEGRTWFPLKVINSLALLLGRGNPFSSIPPPHGRCEGEKELHLPQKRWRQCENQHNQPTPATRDVRVHAAAALGRAKKIHGRLEKRRRIAGGARMNSATAAAAHSRARHKPLINEQLRQRARICLLRQIHSRLGDDFHFHGRDSELFSWREEERHLCLLCALWPIVPKGCCLSARWKFIRDHPLNIKWRRPERKHGQKYQYSNFADAGPFNIGPWSVPRDIEVREPWKG